MNALALFRARRDLSRLWLGEVISQAGDSLFQIALLWIVLELTGSSSVTGLVAMSGYLPVLLFGLLAGSLADRFHRRKLMLVADYARAALVLVIPLLAAFHLLTALQMGFIAFGMAFFTAHFNPARDAIIPQLVEPSELRFANTLVQSGWQIALLAGPALAGLLIPLVGELHLFTVDGFSFLLSALLIAGIRVPAEARRVAAIAGKPLLTELRLALRNVGEGLAHVRRDARLWVLLWITAVDNLFIMGPAIVGTPLFVKQILHGDANQFAYLMTAYAVGMLIGSVLLNLLGKRFKDSHLLLWGIIFDGITFLPLLWVSSFWGAYLTIVIHSLVIPLIVIPRPTLIQRIVPVELHGRVFSMVSVAVTGLTALSVALTGILAEWIPINQIFGAIAILGAACGIAGAFSKRFRQA